MFWVTIARFEVLLRNRLVDSSGSMLLRSSERICTKNHSSRPAPSARKTATSSQSTPSCRIAITTKNMPAADSTAPTVSNLLVLSGGTGSTIRRLSTTTKPTIAACSRKVTRQLIAVVISPPINGPDLRARSTAWEPFCWRLSEQARFPDETKR